MGKVTGFLEIDRQDRKYAPAADRVRHWQDRLDAVGARASVAEEVARLSRQAEDALDALADHGVPAAVRDELSALIRAYTVRAA